MKRGVRNNMFRLIWKFGHPHLTIPHHHLLQCRGSISKWGLLSCHEGLALNAKTCGGRMHSVVLLFWDTWIDPSGSESYFFPRRACPALEVAWSFQAHMVFLWLRSTLGCNRKHSGILQLRFPGRSRAISHGKGHLAARCVLPDSSNGETVTDVVLETFKEWLSGSQPPAYYFFRVCQVDKAMNGTKLRFFSRFEARDSH